LFHVFVGFADDHEAHWFSPGMIVLAWSETKLWNPPRYDDSAGEKASLMLP
jgi:hypothetical protein